MGVVGESGTCGRGGVAVGELFGEYMMGIRHWGVVEVAAHQHTHVLGAVLLDISHHGIGLLGMAAAHKREFVEDGPLVDAVAPTGHEVAKLVSFLAAQG